MAVQINRKTDSEICKLTAMSMSSKIIPDEKYIKQIALGEGEP